MARRLLACALCCLVVAPAAAQAPRITPAGDPSILPDTIYALAIDLADAGDRHEVILLDDGVVIAEADGTARTTYRQVSQVLTREAVEARAELTLGYDAADQEFALNWVRIVAPDGRVVSDTPLLQQVRDAPVAGVSPVYTDNKQVTRQPRPLFLLLVPAAE